MSFERSIEELHKLHIAQVRELRQRRSAIDKYLDQRVKLLEPRKKEK